MRQITLLFILVFVTISCNQTKSKKNKNTDSSNNQIAEKKGMDSSLFLDYVFGMSPTEFDLKSQEFADNGKIQIIDSKIPVYDLDLGNDYEKAVGLIIPYYFDNKLYKLMVSFESESELASTLIGIKLKKILIEKYGQDYDTIYNDLRETNDYLWESDSKIILLKQGTSNVLVEYVDINADEKRKEFELQMEKEKSDKVKNDL